MAGANEKSRSYGLRANIVEKTDTEIIIGYQVSRPDASRSDASVLVSRTIGTIGPGLVEGALALWTLGPFVTSFCTELGKRFGGTVGDWASQIHLHRKRRSRKADLFVNIDDTVVVLDLGKGRRGLSDDAMLAFLDLDFKDQAIRGHRLTWNADARAWVPIGQSGGEEDGCVVPDPHDG